MFALINRDLTDTGKRKAQVDIVPPADLHPDKPYWVPVVNETTDTSTGPDKVVSAWVETVEAARLLRTRTIRDKTAGEMDAEDQARVDRLASVSGIDRAQFLIAFNHENRIRTLEGSPSVTKAQFKTAVKGLIRSADENGEGV